MTSKDAPSVHSLVSSSFDPLLRPFMTSAQPGAEQFLAAHARYADWLPGRSMLVARSDEGGLLGYADFRLVGSSSSFLSYIAVASDARGRGIAGVMLDTFLEKHCDVVSMELDVFADNAPARRLYERRGFQCVGTSEWWTRPVPEPASDTDGWALTNAPAAVAWYSTFGFCEYTIERSGAGKRIGRIGKNTIRCFTASDFADDELLASASALIGGADEAVYIGPSESGGLPTEARSVTTSLRMSAATVRGEGSK